MKSLVQYINEAMKVLKRTKQEPSKDERSKWLKLDIHDKWFHNNFDPLYIKIEDIKDKSQENLLSIAYNLAKLEYGEKATDADILAWGDGDWEQFATAALQKNRRMWHPEYVEKYGYTFESLVNEDFGGSQFGDKAKYSEEDFKKWCSAAGKDFLFTEQGNLVLVYQNLVKPIQKDGYQIDIEHVATYNTKTHTIYTDDMSLFGH